MKMEKRPIKALAFDAYGTLFDVQSVISAVNRKFPGKGLAVSAGWRMRQLEYTWLRSLMGRYEDFWRVTESALVATCNALELSLDAAASPLDGILSSPEALSRSLVEVAPLLDLERS